MKWIKNGFFILLAISCLLTLGTVAHGATPASTGNGEATLAYHLKDLPLGRAVQYFYICKDYVYITQRVDSTTYLSRLEIRGQDAIYLDRMTLTNTGHGETLDFYTHNGKQYFYIGCKAETNTTYCWSIQIARIQYEPNASYTYTDLTRFTNIVFGNGDGTRMGTTLRVAACVNGDYTVFRHQNTDGEFNYSFYSTSKLNALMDKGVQCNLNTDTARSCFLSSFAQTGTDRIQPNGNYQGMDLSSLNSFYLAGGGHGDTPQIARINSTGKYLKLINITNVGQLEIEGVSCLNGRVYFAIVPGTTEAIKKSSHKIYYLEESVFGVKHTISTTGGIAPTCTKAGLTALSKCTTCNQPLSVQEPIAPTGHTVQTNAPVPPGCETEGRTEHSYCTVCAEVFTQGQAVPPTGHRYEYSTLGDLTHEVTCASCELSREEMHILQDGVCICADRTGEPVLKEDLVLYHTLDLASDISVNYAVPVAQLEDFDLSTVTMECRLQEAKGEKISVLRPELRGEYYYFTLKDLTAVHMSNRILAVLRGSRGIRNYYSPTDDYSIADYAYNRLDAPASPKALKALCAELLRYGGAAQTYKGYCLDTLADRNMTELHKSYLADLSAVAPGEINMELPSLREPFVTWEGKSLALDSKITVRYIIRPTGHTEAVTDLRLVIRYQGIDGKENLAEFTDPQPYGNKGELYAFDFDGLLVAELRTVLMATVYEGEVAVSTTLLYSPDTYARGKSGTLATLCNALLAYSDAAKAYFLE